MGSAAYSNDDELSSLKCQNILSTSEIPRPRSAGKNSDQLSGDGEVRTPPLSRKERIGAFESKRRRSSHKINSQALKVLRVQAWPSSADQHANFSKSRAKRIEEFEAERRRSSHKHENHFLNLLRIQAAQTRPSDDLYATAAKRRAEYEVKRHAEML